MFRARTLVANVFPLVPQNVPVALTGTLVSKSLNNQPGDGVTPGSAVCNARLYGTKAALEPLLNGNSSVYVEDNAWLWDSKSVRLMCRRYNSTVSLKTTRAAVKLIPEVEDAIVDNQLKAKRHPGLTTLKCVDLPGQFKTASEVVLQGLEFPDTELIKEAGALVRYLEARKPPVENMYWRQRATELEQQMADEEKTKRNTDVLDNITEEKIKKKVVKKLKEDNYHWEPVNYNSSKALLYLVGRAAPDYAVLIQVFTELKRRLPNFLPKAVLDFGSGVGTVFWATHTMWKGSFKEYYAVDSSADMNSVAQRLLQGGREDRQPFFKKSFFRQFLPASHTLGYELVVSSYSLMELPNIMTRLQTLDNLWSKTEGFLVLIENGTNAGYKLILEARDYILQTSGADVHVFSPCSHDLACPRAVDKTPCNFEAGFTPLLPKKSSKQIVRYSYVIFQKTKRNSEESWPRIVRPVLPRSGHVVCHLCCDDGKLKETVVTVSKNGKATYRCARASRWGDRLPVSNTEIKSSKRATDSHKEDPTSS